jgi:hypothetical protein
MTFEQLMERVKTEQENSGKAEDWDWKDVWMSIRWLLDNYYDYQTNEYAREVLTEIASISTKAILELHNDD